MIIVISAPPTMQAMNTHAYCRRILSANAPRHAVDAACSIEGADVRDAPVARASGSGPPTAAPTRLEAAPTGLEVAPTGLEVAPTGLAAPTGFEVAPTGLAAPTGFEVAPTGL